MKSEIVLMITGEVLRGESDFALQHPGRPGAFRCWKLYAQQHFTGAMVGGKKPLYSPFEKCRI